MPNCEKCELLLHTVLRIVKKYPVFTTAGLKIVMQAMMFEAEGAGNPGEAQGMVAEAVVPHDRTQILQAVL